MTEDREREAFYEWEGQNDVTPLGAWLERASRAPSPSASGDLFATACYEHGVLNPVQAAALFRIFEGKMHAKRDAAPSVLTDERIVQIFYPMGTATDNQKLIAIAIARAILQANGATK